MNYFNIQKEILKNAENKFLGKKSKRYFYYEKEKEVLLSDCYMIIIIPSNACVLNLKEVAEYGEFLNKIQREEPRYHAVKINSIYKYDSIDYQVFKIPEKDNIKVYINQKYLKDFEKKTSKYDTNDLIFKCDSPASPLYVYRYEELVGVITPMIISS